MDTIGLWQINEATPARLTQCGLAAERDLESWIEHDPGLLERGLVIVGRQLRLEGGPLDLLALDPQGRWVLIEIKRERLRRDVIAQAIDYASCLHRLDGSRLRSQCDDYLRSRSGGLTTLDTLLSERGRSLDAEQDGRDVVIYLVGTGYDPGLERMVAYLTDRAELALRIVTFSTFQDAAGHLLLAREIHEPIDELANQSRVVARPRLELESILAAADQNGVGPVVRTLYAAATDVNLRPRPYTSSIMFAPPANRTRCLFAVWVERRREPGVAKTYIAAEAFEQFFGIAEQDLVQAVGHVGYVMLDETGAHRVAAGLKHLLQTTDT